MKVHSNPRIAALPGPFEINRIIEFEGAHASPDHLFPDATAEAFAATATANNPQLYDRLNNRLVMSFHGIVVKTPQATFLIDSCLGNHKPRPRNPLWHMRDGPFLSDLSDAGFHPEQIDYVLCTHLHADHVGWNTQLRDGRWVPTFPNARYLFARKEIEYWRTVIETRDPDANHGSWHDSVRPVFDAGLAQVVGESDDIAAGVRLVPAPGHSPGNVMVRLEHGSSVAVVAGDTVHHPVQVERPEWSTRFCWDPEMSRHARKHLFESLAGTGHWLLPAHFPTPSAARIEGASDSYRCVFAPT